MGGFTGIRRGGEEHATSEDPSDIEVWADGEWQATWNAKDNDFPWKWEGMITRMMWKVFEAGEKARSAEIFNLISGG